jgi:hypothetical protein
VYGLPIRNISGSHAHLIKIYFLYFDFARGSDAAKMDEKSIILVHFEF